jgi:ferredoxin
VKIVIDAERCTGHGRCYSLVPELFDSDEQGHSVLLAPDVDIAADQQRQAQVAVDNCPEDAISLQE